MSHDPVENNAAETSDAVESITPYIPFIIPLAGAVMMFILAFIAVTMA
ncbi:hypothetical protein [Comamonas composti]|nr:hypothetical protein [Comamonas composti]